jgi:hypothetical protein
MFQNMQEDIHRIDELAAPEMIWLVICLLSDLGSTKQDEG